LGPYEITASLGAGGMGEVYRAKDTKLGREVALKILPASFTNDPERVARFRREAQVLASLNHPHIAQIYGLEEANGTQFLVLELVDGESLDKGIARGRIPVDEALGIAKQIAEALEAAHEKGIIHRDLKPANIALTKDGQVKVLDFGLAKAVETTSGSVDAMNSPTITTPAMMTGIGVILGTAAYMSPEQAKGRAADKRSDVWAFGCVMFEMLTGRRLFRADDVSETLAFVLTRDPDWSAVPLGVPSSIHALIQGCLRKDRHDRIGDISTARFLLSEPRAVFADPRSGTSTAGQKRRLALAVGGALVVGAALAAAVLPQGNRRPSQAVTRFTIALPPGQVLTLPRQAVALSPDGTQLAYGADGRLFVRSMAEREPKLITGAATALSPAFSPDGQSVAFWSDATLKRVAVTGGAAVTISAIGPAPSGITWASDAIMFAQAGTGISRVAPTGGRPEVIVAPTSADELILGPQLLPDGDSLLFTITQRGAGADPWDKARIVVQSLKTSQRKTLIDGGSDGRYIPTGHLAYTVGGTLFAVPFELATRTVTGGAVPLVDGVRRVTAVTVGGAHFAFSRSGSLVYVPGPQSGGQQDLMLFDRKGAAEELKLPPGYYEYPRVSPDGKLVAFETSDGKETNVSIYELSGVSSVRRLTFGGNNRFPIWSADGRHVAFQSDREGDLAVFWQPAGGGTAERLTKPEPGTLHLPESWSPAGDALLFSASKGSETSLWIYDVRNRKVAPFDDVKSSPFPPDAAFSPDGHWVAYQVGELNQGEGTTYVQPFPPNGTKYQIARGGRPLWSRDGTELFYVPAPTQFSMVKVRTQPSFSFTSPVAVPRGFGVADPLSPRPYDIMPDGRIVGVGIVGQTQPGSASQIEVVLNWFEELKARVPIK
jgi:serine/threonine-protein kinase